MALSLGIINFGVEADTSSMDKKLNKSEQKISRFANAGLRNFGKLNNVSTSKLNRQLETNTEKLAKSERQARRTLNEIQELETKMNKIKLGIADTSGLNLKRETSKGSANPMSNVEYKHNLDALASENTEYSKILGKQIKLAEKLEEQNIGIAKSREKIQELRTEIDATSKSNFFKKRIY